MKTKKSYIGFIALLLVFSMLLSLFFILKESKHDCPESVCSYCTQIQEYEESLEQVTLSHGSCIAEDFEICEEIVEYGNKLRTMYASAHECIEEDCIICSQINAYVEKLKQLFIYAVAFIMIVVAAYYVVFFVERKKKFFRPFTLVFLKVKLTA